MSSRPILKLPFRAAPPVVVPEPMWICKPCGTQFELPKGPDDTVVRCPSCSAKLGKLEAFKEGSTLSKPRARPAAVA